MGVFFFKCDKPPFFSVPILPASSLLLLYFTVRSLLIWLIFERSPPMFSVCKQLSAAIRKEAVWKMRLILERYCNHFCPLGNNLLQLLCYLKIKCSLTAKNNNKKVNAFLWQCLMGNTHPSFESEIMQCFHLWISHARKQIKKIIQN